MKRKMLSAFAAAGVLVILGGIPTFAAISGEMHTKVPFAFRVEGKTLPAGEYVLTNPRNAPDVLEIRNESGAPAVLVMTEPLSPPNGESVQPHLVFDKVGKLEYLAQVWSGTAMQGNQVIGVPTSATR